MSPWPWLPPVQPLVPMRGGGMDAQGVSGLEHLLTVLAHEAGVGDVARLHVIAHAGPDRRDVGAVETVPHALLAVHHRLQGGVQLLQAGAY